MNIALPDRVLAEQLFHDEQSALRASTFQHDPTRLLVQDEDYLDHESWIRPAFEQLGPLYGRTVLDYGCGHGMASVVLARAGAQVTGFDVSPGYVQEATQRAKANQVAARFLVADGHHLPFEDSSFDAVWGCAILHHLDLKQAGSELHRVLKPGGVAVFCEPWGGNPLLEFARKYLPYPGKHRTTDEQPLTEADLVPLKGIFATWQLRGFQLFSMVKRAWPTHPLQPAFARLDQAVLNRWPTLYNWCRYVVITLHKTA